MGSVTDSDRDAVFRQYLQSTGKFTNKAALDAFANDKQASDGMRQEVYSKTFYTDGGVTRNDPITGQTVTDPINYNLKSGSVAENLRELNGYLRGQKSYSVGAKLDTSIAAFQKQSGLNANQVDLKAVPGSLILRSRFDILPDDAARETMQQQVQDSSFSDFFSFVPPNGELGYKNSLFLQNRQHEKMMLYDSNTKPINNVPNTLGFHSSLNDLQFVPVLADLREIEKSTVLRTPFKNLSGIAALPGSNIVSEEPFSDEIRSSFLIPGEIQPGPFTRDNFSQPLAADFNNYIGMKPYYDQMRHPFNPSFQPTAQRSEGDMLIQAYMLGPQIY